MSRSAPTRVRRFWGAGPWSGLDWVFGAVLGVSLLNVVNERWVHLASMSRALRAEDHVVEWLTFASFLLAGVLAGKVAVATTVTRHRLVWFAIAGCTLFVAGEEVSWFQRVLGFATPDPLVALNSQGETTVHNLVLFGLPLTTWVFSVGVGVVLFLYFIGLPWLARLRPRVADQAGRWGLPVPSPMYGLSLIVLLALNHGLAPGTSGNEVMEMSGAVLWLHLIAHTSSRGLDSQGQRTS